MPLKISVIVPIYNAEQYLEKCLESIVRQSYLNLEILLVDDGSTDSSGMIIDRYAEEDPRITVVHKRNGGIGSAYEAAFNIMTGDYISFIDSDDYVETYMYEELVEVAQRDTPDIIQFGRRRINSSGEVISEDKLVGAVIEGNDSILLSHFTDYGTPSLACRIFKSTLFNNIQSFQRSIGVDETLFIQVITQCEKYVVLERKYYYQYIRSDSVGHVAVNPKKLMDSIEVHRFICDFIAETRTGFSSYAVLKYLKYLYSVLTGSCDNKELQKSDEFILAKNEYKAYYDLAKSLTVLTRINPKLRKNMLTLRKMPSGFIVILCIKNHFSLLKRR